ncbi:MAG TPA: 2-oxoisovalerate dehydrogenase [Ignavibacteria bacterium]|nr:2-oxoisovalerate dehydrogenase [Bacteroidota bacterium]HRE09242.1 2-oxoisovalerate dehydrogenase [Ignavibacteria bacterium]HRF66204.1 2-oxoisovalerate dehydrogenase [Ignavibacteria bacterium]HRJ03850.1 2-oxoisovalerate dehydrogenase [Ignavibacteria bacterium]HRJ85081.1 2-oxoisovalerate dehydrogenase [Ignavibacteria bacterium]
MKETEVIFVVEESNEGGYEARALNHSIFTEADDPDMLKANIIDAVKCHFDEANIPSVIRLHFVREELIAV